MITAMAAPNLGSLGGTTSDITKIATPIVTRTPTADPIIAFISTCSPIRYKTLQLVRGCGSSGLCETGRVRLAFAAVFWEASEASVERWLFLGR